MENNSSLAVVWYHRGLNVLYPETLSGILFIHFSRIFEKLNTSPSERGTLLCNRTLLFIRYKRQSHDMLISFIIVVIGDLIASVFRLRGSLDLDIIHTGSFIFWIWFYWDSKVMGFSCLLIQLDLLLSASITLQCQWWERTAHRERSSKRFTVTVLAKTFWPLRHCVSQVFVLDVIRSFLEA